jgi:RNA polymerase sigma-70 factor, ECF subfamily
MATKTRSGSGRGRSQRSFDVEALGLTSQQAIRKQEELLRRAKAGDAEAMTALYREHAPRLYHYFVVRLQRDSEQAEDLTAQVFVRTLERLDSYECRGLPFGAWLFRVASNLLIDYQRSLPRDPVLPLEVCEQREMPAAERELAQVLDQEDLGRAMRRLTAEQQRVLQLRFIEGHSIAQTQAIMGKTEEAVKKLQARGLQALQHLLRGHERQAAIAEKPMAPLATEDEIPEPPHEIRTIPSPARPLGPGSSVPD